MRLRLCYVVGAMLLALGACGDDQTSRQDTGPIDAPLSIDGRLVLYTFNEGVGVTVGDVSGVAPAIDLSVFDPDSITWDSGSLRIDDATLIRSDIAAAKVSDAIFASEELTIEMWLTPLDAAQTGPARLLSLGRDASTHNVMLGQESDRFVARLRTFETDANGQQLETDGGQVVAGQLTHVVFTRSTTGMARIFVNSAIRAELNITGQLLSWDSTFQLSLANEADQSEGPWRGTYHRVGVFDNAFSADMVFDRFQAGP